MTTGKFRFEALNDGHDRVPFHCGDAALDRYFQTQLTQDLRRRMANCFVLLEVESARIAAFYTLSAASIALTDLPPAESKRLPRYPAVPVVRIGRLAVDQGFRGVGWVNSCS